MQNILISAATKKQRTTLRFWGILLTSFLAVAISSTTTLAHDDLIAAIPESGQRISEPPSEIRLTFSGQLQPGSTFTIFDKQFNQYPVPVFIDPEVPNDLVSQSPELLKSGVYTIQWLVISSDGHSLTGSYSFEIQLADQAESSSVETAQPESGETTEMLLLAPLAESTAFNPPAAVAWIMVILALGVPYALWMWARNK